jgi:dolichol-phosphate mannosyltransferase
MLSIRWPLVSILAIAYLLALRLAFLGLVNLMPEEAYYWNYAQHLDFGYLDHPPMVAWLIWLSTSVLGKSEFSVRLPAYISWAIAALFMFRLTVNLYDKSAAIRSVLLMAALPIYFGLGFFMTPDAPLNAAWAGSLYFLERALIAENRKAWWGVGLCLGFGLLSKYTIALLGLATLTFVLIARQSRRWLLRREPYLAALGSVILFSPVVLWNMRNDWISFLFQGPERWSGTSELSLHWLLVSCLLVLTPAGLLGVIEILLPRRPTGMTSPADMYGKQRFWVLSFTLIPLCVFVIHSLFHETKLHWAAPVWLAAIPLLSCGMVPERDRIVGSLARLGQRLWMPTIIVLLLAHTGFLSYVSLGLPGAPPVSKIRAFGDWRAMADRVEKIEKSVKDKTGSEPVTVGMDKYPISSELSFYDFVDNNDTGGPHLFGGRSLMWAFWLPESAVLGRNFLMVDFDRQRLGDLSLSQYFDATSGVFTEALEKDGRLIGYFHWRVGYGYRGIGTRKRGAESGSDP